MAIAAHFEPGKPRGKARDERRTLLFDALGTAGSGETEVLIHNISATGLLLECNALLEPGEAIEIDLPQAGPTIASIVWASGRLFGCAFKRPISNATLSAAQLRSVHESELDLSHGTPSGNDETFGARLQRLRKARGLTLAEIAEQLEVSKPTVWAWEKDRARPVEDRIAPLSKVLGVNPAELQRGGADPVLLAVVARSREQIAEACGTGPDKVRIFIEL